MRILTGEDEARIEELERKIQRDLRLKPMDIMTNGELISIEHDPNHEPIISNLLVRYKNLEYRFNISSIDIELVP